MPPPRRATPREPLARAGQGADALNQSARVQVAPQTLELIGRELSAALNEARAALEAFVESQGNATQLDRVAVELHRVQGVLRMLEVYGGALLAEEMEQVTRYLIATSGERKNQDESLDALLRAMEQLPSYLDRVLAGGRDLALVLLPLLNDLRAVRGSPLLSEGTLLLLNLRSDATAAPKARLGAAPGQVEQLARRLRAQFQLGLVGWIRGERTQENLAALSQVAERMEGVATQQPVYQLWWVTGAVVEALRDQGLEDSVSVKRLLGLADRELKRLYEQGEARYCDTPPVELLNNLLYYVARATSNGVQTAAVRSAFRLDELLPVDQDVDEERETLSAPSIKLMQTVAVAIREDLGKIKDTLDIFVRRGSGQPAELAPQIELLRKIGDTLGVLGLGELRGLIQGELGRLEAIVVGRAPAVETALIDIASSLIQVEDRLDSSLLQMIIPSRSSDAIARDSAGEPASEEFLHVQSAVLRECIVNLARVKESVAQNVGGTLDAAALDMWPGLMRGIKAGLLMLGRTRAVALCDAIADCLRRVMQPGGAGLTGSYLDRLADAIVSVEYYMETLQAGRAEPVYMLDNAQSCLQSIAAMPEAVAPTVPALPEAAYARTVRLDEPGSTRTELLPSPEEPIALPADIGATTRRLRALAELEQAAPPREPPVLAPAVSEIALQAPVGRPRVDDVDPEIRVVFIEEAREEVARIAEYFPEWERNLSDVEALQTVRRSFHTLKGSGRMVGASELAEFSWSIENLLNHILDGTLERSGAIMETLREAVAALPPLVDCLDGGPAAPASLPALVARAHALAAGQTTSARAEAAAAELPTTAPALEPATSAAGSPSTSDTAPRDLADSPLDELASVPDQHFSATDVTPSAEIEFELADSLAKPDAPVVVHSAADDAVAAAAAAAAATLASDAAAGSALAEIYERETAAHVATVRDYLSREQLMPEPHRLTEAVYRACHTLSGSSQMAEARHGVRLAEPLNRWLRKAWDAQIGLRDGDLALLSDCMDGMQQVARRLDESTQFFVAHDLLRARLAAAEAELDRRIAEESQRAAHVSRGRADAERSDMDLEAQAEAEAGFDAEVAAIFTDEATELLEASEAALAEWRAAPGDIAALGGLKRPLHTLKGGARMAGVRSMGDLAHELETSIGQIELGLIPADARAVGAMQQSLDELARMRDRLAEGQLPPAATASLEALRALTLPPPAAGFAPEPAGSADAEPVDEVVLQGDTASVPDIAATGSYAAQALLPGRESAIAGEAREMARVDADLLDSLLNNAGEVSIGRARLEQQVGAIGHNLGELSRTVTRLKEQLRKLEIETEKQILHRYESEGAHRGDFDPLELDRYSSIQQFSRALGETASDVASIQQLLESLTQDTENLLQQQTRVVTELQNGLMRTRMVPFQRHVQRLTRIVRQAAVDEGKQAELVIEGASGELDRQVLERMLGPFEHILRNAVVHGLESPADRRAHGKDETGRITMTLRREGSEVIVEVADDGAGLDLDAIRGKARELGVVPAGRELSDAAAMQLILEPGFSTADRLTQHAGRGVGMDVVATEVKKLGGALLIESRAGHGARFIVRLPFTLAISHALVVRVEDEYYALPLPVVEGVIRLGRDEVANHLASDVPSYEYSGQKYRLQPLSIFVGLAPTPPPEQDASMPVVLVRSGEYSTGLVVEELIGSREIVVKSVGPQVSAIRGISGATVLGDGRVVIILDVTALLRSDWRERAAPVVVRDRIDQQPVALVVDDSITVRRVTQRLLERNGMRVLTARDGMDAVAMLAEQVPDVILLDIEMPRMDGYEVAAHVRNDPRTCDVPIIMITSRVGDKHRARAIELGVNDYLGKPYQEAQLLEAIEPLLAKRRQRSAHG